jgi:hypothetical protein
VLALPSGISPLPILARSCVPCVLQELQGQKKAKLENLERERSQLEAMGLSPQKDVLSKSIDTVRETIIDPKRRTRRRGKAADWDEFYSEYCLCIMLLCACDACSWMVIPGSSTDTGVNGPEFLFDVGRGAETTFCPASKRDSWYEPRLKAQVTAWSNGNAVLQGADKRLGSSSLNITSRDYGVGARELEEYTRRTKAPVEFEASPHSRRSILDQQLNRATGALLPPFNANSNSAAGPPGSTLNL